MLNSKLPHLRHRAEILKLLRQWMCKNGYLEVETPIRVLTPGTDVNLEAYPSGDRYLITSPEFHMKRLLAAGYERIYQICRCFRKGERSRLHNPEFTMLEFYATGLNIEGMMAEVERLIGDTARAVGKDTVVFDRVECHLAPPWKRISVEEAFLEYAGWSPIANFDEERFYDLVDKVEIHLGSGRPAILYHYPPELAMLAKVTSGELPVARRFEIYVSGVEIANAFEELNDPVEQRRRFESDLKRRDKRNKRGYPIDDLFLESLADMPDSSGIAVGVDRLVMLLTGGESIDDVIAFPDEDV